MRPCQTLADSHSGPMGFNIRSFTFICCVVLLGSHTISYAEQPVSEEFEKAAEKNRNQIIEALPREQQKEIKKKLEERQDIEEQECTDLDLHSIKVHERKQANREEDIEKMHFQKKQMFFGRGSSVETEPEVKERPEGYARPARGNIYKRAELVTDKLRSLQKKNRSEKERMKPVYERCDHRINGAETEK